MGPGTFRVAAILAVVALAGGLTWSLMDESRQEQKIRDLESRIATLQASLRERERATGMAHLPRRDPATANAATGKAATFRGAPAAAGEVTGSYEILKELEDESSADRRSPAEKLMALLANDPGDEEAAIAARFIFNEAADTQGLPDYALQSIYAGQKNPDLRRVIAQVMSQRGNDTLLHDQVAEAQATLKSRNPKERLDALNQLGKIHSVHAVDAITPSLQDSDSTVRLAALFALRDSGNQRHVGLVEPMTHDPDPSVSTLAENVVSALKNLSSTARTRYSSADIEAELPPIANP